MIGAVLGVAHDDVASGELGIVAIEGVFIVLKVSGTVIGQGESLTWDISAEAFDGSTATVASDDITGATAFAAEAAGAGVASFAVKFTGVPGTVKA